MRELEEGPNQRRGALELPSAVAELSARVDEVVGKLSDHASLTVTEREALRVELIELARTHAARTVLEAATARYAAKHPKNRGRWRRQRP